MACLYCRYPGDGSPKYEYVPYDLDHLREHTAELHPERLTAFDPGWKRLASPIKQKWLENGTRRPFLRYDLVEWNGWAEAVRVIIQDRIDVLNRLTRDGQVDWKFAIGGRNFYPLPDMGHVNPPERTGRVDWHDMSIFLEGFWVMRAYQALCELRSQWGNREERKAIFREVLQFYGVYDVYGEIPELDF
jgi:hypothetical protein